MGSIGRRLRGICTRVLGWLDVRLHGETDDTDETLERMASNMEAESALWERTAKEAKSIHRRVYAEEKRYERAESARRLRTREEEFLAGIFSGMQGGGGRR